MIEYEVNGDTMNENNNIKPNPRLNKTIHEVIEKQIENKDPYEVYKALQRMMASGLSREEAINEIGLVLIEQIYNITKHKRPFNEKEYMNKLSRLK